MRLVTAKGREGRKGLKEGGRSRKVDEIVKGVESLKIVSCSNLISGL